MPTKSRHPRTHGPYTVRIWRYVGRTGEGKHEHVQNDEATTRGEAESKAKALLMRHATLAERPEDLSATVTDGSGTIVTSYSIRRNFVSRLWEVRREHAA